MWATILTALLSVLPDFVQEWIRARQDAREAAAAKRKELDDALKELQDALYSGDVDRITRARRNLDRLQKP